MKTLEQLNPYDHQLEIIKDNPKRTGIFRGTGAGKTRIATYLAEGVTLVICPKTQTEDGTWTDEFEFQEKDKLTILSKEQIKMKQNYYTLMDNKFDTIIVDEAHYNAGVLPSTFQKLYEEYPKVSGIHSMTKKIIKNNPEAKVYLLTATPATDPMKLYGIASLLGYNWDYFQFRRTFYFEQRRNVWLRIGKKRGGGLTPQGKVLKDKLAKIVNNIGYIGKLDDWFDVPEQSYKTIDVGTTKGQQDAYQELKLLYPLPLVQIGKRRMLEQGLFEGSLLTENKTAVIEEFLHEFGKVVVFAKYTDQINMYADKLGKNWKVFTLTGATKDRGDVIREANESESCVFIIQNQISEGYELINKSDEDADKDFECVIFATEYAYKDYVQGKGRVQRAKRVKHNLYVSLVAGGGDQAARQNMLNGEDFDEAVHAENLARSNKL